MKIGILGGSFDPPHNGHLYVANSLLKNKYCQKIILMPCFKHPFDKPLTDAKHRLTMTELLEKDSIEVSGMEVKKESTSYTIDTLKVLKAQSPNDDLVWIIGEDQIESFTKWKKWREIIEEFGLIVVPRHKRHSGEPSSSGRLQNQVSKTDSGRAPSSLARMTGSGITVLSGKTFKPLDISSSEIRKRIKERLRIDELVPKEIKSYIIKNKLYSI